MRGVLANRQIDRKEKDSPGAGNLVKEYGQLIYGFDKVAKKKGDIGSEFSIHHLVSISVEKQDFSFFLPCFSSYNRPHHPSTPPTPTKPY